MGEEKQQLQELAPEGTFPGRDTNASPQSPAFFHLSSNCGLGLSNKFLPSPQPLPSSPPTPSFLRSFQSLFQRSKGANKRPLWKM